MTIETDLIQWKEGRAFAHYHDWECFHQGYWSNGKCEHKKWEQSSEVLTTGQFMGAMRSVVLCWPVSSAVHLSNTSINRLAWLGQAACFFDTGNCADCTIRSWFELNSSEQKLANLVAKEMVRQWNQVNFDRENCRAQSDQLGLAF